MVVRYAFCISVEKMQTEKKEKVRKIIIKMQSFCASLCLYGLVPLTIIRKIVQTNDQHIPS